MSAQMSLFSAVTTPPARASPHPRKEDAGKRHPVASPWGKPDKRGKYAYEKLWGEVEKLPGRLQTEFMDLTTGLREDDGKQFLKCFKMFFELDNSEMLDFDESRGQL